MSSNKKPFSHKKINQPNNLKQLNQSRFKLLITYQGYQYQGWQKQKHTSSTIQEIIETSLNNIFQKKIRIYGASRTDAGTHARGQVAHLNLSKSVPVNFPLQRALNALLPSNIVIQQVTKVSNDFHALHSAQRKHYSYLILNNPLPCVFRKELTYWYPYKVDFGKLSDMAKVIEGSQDFKSFQTSGTLVKSTIRQVYSAQWEKQKSSILAFHIQGDSFLKQMIRNLVGTQLALLKHKEPVQRLKHIFTAQDRRQALDTAPAYGLYLCKIQYSKQFEQNQRN